MWLSLVERCVPKLACFSETLKKNASEPLESEMWAGKFAQTVPLLRFMALPNSQEAGTTARTVILAILWSSLFPLARTSECRNTQTAPKDCCTFLSSLSQDPAWI